MATEKLKIDILADSSNAVAGVKKVGLTIDELKDKVKYYQDLAFSEKDVSKLRTYNSELQKIQTTLKQTSNVGKVGFDEMGVAVKGSANELSKAFSSVRQLAYILPGIGMAGLFNLAFEGIGKAIEALGLFNSKLSDTQKLYANLNDVYKEANKKAGQEIIDMRLLAAAATDVNLTMAERLRAASKLKEGYPEYLKNISAETIANGGAKKALDELTNSIISNARAKAASTKIGELESQKLDLQIKKAKEFQDATKRIGEAKGFTVVGGQGGASFISAETQQRDIKGLAEARMREWDKQIADLSNQQSLITSVVGQTALERAIIPPPEKIKAAVEKVFEEVYKDTSFFKEKFRLQFVEHVDLVKPTTPPKKLSAQGNVLIGEGLQLKDERKKQLDDYNQSIKDTIHLAQLAASGFTKMWTAMEQGKDIGDAFGEMFRELAKKIASAAAEAAIFVGIMEILAPGSASAVGGFGGMFKSLLGFASGGTVSGPTSGYPVMLHGTEHIVRPDQMNRIVGGAAQMGQMMGGGSSAGEFILRGNDLVLAMQRANYSLNIRRGG